MTFKLSQRSLDRLVGVHPKLVTVVRRAIEVSTVDFMVGEGVRSAERQAALYAQGRTKPGNIVTWVRVSQHQVKADGLGHAVDLWALDPGGAIDWGSIPLYEAVYKAMFRAAGELGTAIRSGMDWDRDGVLHEHGEVDLAHYELVGV